MPKSAQVIRSSVACSARVLAGESRQPLLWGSTGFANIARASRIALADRWIGFRTEGRFSRHAYQGRGLSSVPRRDGKVLCAFAEIGTQILANLRWHSEGNQDQEIAPGIRRDESETGSKSSPAQSLGCRRLAKKYVKTEKRAALCKLARIVNGAD
jgi:hypothetical protein